MAAADSLPLELDDELKAAVAGAFESKNHFTVAYLGDDGWPHVSRRGTVQVLGPKELAIWVRKRDDGLAPAMARRPEITLYQFDSTKPQVYTLYGRGRVSDDADLDARVYESSPDPEQAQDPERKGVALVVELDRIVARGVRTYEMERDPAHT